MQFWIENNKKKIKYILLSFLLYSLWIEEKKMRLSQKNVELDIKERENENHE